MYKSESKESLRIKMKIDVGHLVVHLLKLMC